MTYTSDVVLNGERRPRPGACFSEVRAMLATIPALEKIRYGPGGGVYKIVATAAETRNMHFAFEAIEPAGGGPPLHTHANEDEFLLVLEGEMTFYVGGKVTRAIEGQTAFVPRSVPHCFKNCSKRESRVLVMFTPGNIEGLFEYGNLPAGTTPTDELLLARLNALAPEYGLEVLGPSPL
jgi:quercetin dioxygenase-like cupin family protein